MAQQQQQMPPLRPPQQPMTQQQALAWMTAEAAKHNMTVEQFQQVLRAQAERQHAEQQKMAQQQQQQQGQQVPIQPGPPNPQALAVAKWLRSQELKPRTCILNGQRKDMFKVKRAIRALLSPTYAKASAKNPALPPVKDRESAEAVFKLLPLSLLAVRVTKIDPHEGHNHAPPKKTKRTKGLWTVKIEQQQEVRDELHFVWIYEGPQLKQKLYALGALIVIMAVVMFPLWPMKMRLGVWYLSMGMLGLIGLFFAMSIFRLILFCVTMFAVPPGLWLYPNLFEDVGFFDSFRPVWGWQEEKKKKRSKKPKTGDAANTKKASSQQTGGTTSATPISPLPPHSRRDIHPRVEEVFDED